MACVQNVDEQQVNLEKVGIASILGKAGILGFWAVAAPPGSILPSDGEPSRFSSSSRAHKKSESLPVYRLNLGLWMPVSQRAPPLP